MIRFRRLDWKRQSCLGDEKWFIQFLRIISQAIAVIQLLTEAYVCELFVKPQCVFRIQGHGKGKFQNSR
jgi:hypothetical protein